MHEREPEVTIIEDNGCQVMHIKWAHVSKGWKGFKEAWEGVNIYNLYELPYAS